MLTNDDEDDKLMMSEVNSESSSERSRKINYVQIRRFQNVTLFRSQIKFTSKSPAQDSTLHRWGWCCCVLCVATVVAAFFGYSVTNAVLPTARHPNQSGEHEADRKHQHESKQEYKTSEWEWNFNGSELKNNNNHHHHQTHQLTQANRIRFS